MKLLVTAFEPFDGASVNPSLLVLERLSAPKGLDLEKCVLPVTFHGAPAALKAALTQTRPDAVLCLGQAGGRAAVTPEWVGINWMDARIPDNEGVQPAGRKIDPDGPDAIFSTLPVYAMAAAAREKGIPAAVSFTAGTFVCNCVLYSALRLSQTAFPNLRAAFVHVPFLPEQAAGKNAPALTLAQMTAALNAMVRVTGRP